MPSVEQQAPPGDAPSVSQDAAEPTGPAPDPAPPTEVEGTAAPDAAAEQAQPPEQAADPEAQGDQPAASPGQWILEVVTTPKGARVEAGEQRISAPGRFVFDSFPKPLRVEATKSGFKASATTVLPSSFEDRGGNPHRRIYLRLRRER